MRCNLKYDDIQTVFKQFEIQQGPEGRTGALARAKQLAVFQPPTRLTNGALATAKQQGPEGRTGPAGNGPQCLTLLSEPTRKLAFIQPPTRLTNGALATAKQQGPDGRTGPAGNASQCLTSLSEPTRKLAVWAETAPSPEVRTGPAGRGPCLPAARLHKRRLRHTKTAGPAGHGPQCLTSLSEPTSQRGSQTAPSPQRNSRALMDGPGLRATAPSA